MSFEEAKPIPEWPYFIDEDAVVYNKSGRIRKQSIDKRSKYSTVILFRNGSYKTFKVYRLMAKVYLGPKPFPGAMVLHNDSDHTNSRKSNLRWGTRSENEADRREIRNRKMQERIQKARMMTMRKEHA